MVRATRRVCDCGNGVGFSVNRVVSKSRNISRIPTIARDVPVICINVYMHACVQSDTMKLSSSLIQSIGMHVE